MLFYGYALPCVHAEGLPEPWDPQQYVYAYVCKKHRLQLPSALGEKVVMSDSWRQATRETLQRCDG